MLKIAPGMGPMPSNWLPYFMVADCDASAATAANRGKLHVPPMAIPHIGRFAVIADPQGASFAIIKLNLPS
jgi:predicted enzyme related to lactoylglutathione lyase